MIMTRWPRFLRRFRPILRNSTPFSDFTRALDSASHRTRFRRFPFANHSETVINYASRYNPRPKRLLRRLNYSFERFDVLENCRDTRDGRCFIIQQLKCRRSCRRIPVLRLVYRISLWTQSRLEIRLIKTFTGTVERKRCFVPGFRRGHAAARCHLQETRRHADAAARARRRYDSHQQQRLQRAPSRCVARKSKVCLNFLTIFFCEYHGINTKTSDDIIVLK